ncbi:hypothetical protein RD792_005979 [Penstemon davidsonii]|uniref:SKP1-like protein n=1 Tax=Penstemon davidsonii TaxID=160366 RepID=A0ABR0DEW1_9LAMI|nr:hypothetical protein RD792_005979 [Penstemon davidsonii]
MSSSQAKPNTTPSSELIFLKTFDKVTFSVERSVITKSITIKNLLDDGCADGGGIIPLHNVNGKTLSIVIDYLTKHAELPNESSEIKVFDNNFTQGLSDPKIILDLLLAANYLEIKELLDLISQKIADYIRDKQPEEVRKIFNIENDYTEEEEAAVRNEFPWVFENKDA